MKFYVIHNRRFPLRRVFLQAQFKRYDITDFEFIEIPGSHVISSTYIHLLHIISRNKNKNSDKIYCILIDTVLITRNFLDRVQYGHVIAISSEKSQDIIFVHPIYSNSSNSPNSSNSQKIKKQIKTLHKDTWKWDDHTNYSSCFIITSSCAKLMVEYHKYCEDNGEYDDINQLWLYKNSKTGIAEQTLASFDNWLYKCVIMHSNYPLQSLWIS